MKRRMAIILMLLFTFPSVAGASIILEEIEDVKWVEFNTYPFTAEVEPFIYEATLTDLSSPPLELDFLFLSITTAQSIILPFTRVEGSGSFLFDVTEGTKYYAHVLSAAFGAPPLENRGLYSLTISSVPIPSALMLLASGIIGLVGVRRRVIRQ